MESHGHFSFGKIKRDGGGGEQKEGKNAHHQHRLL